MLLSSGWRRQPEDKSIVELVKTRKNINNKGLYAHSASSYVFDLRRRWKHLQVKIGLHANSHEKPVIEVTGVRTLDLLCEGVEGHNHNSWAIWADPKLKR
jgi:hypothetical protein